MTSGLSDGYEGLSEKSEKTAARRTAGKLFRRRARSRLRITGVTEIKSSNTRIELLNEVFTSLRIDSVFNDMYTHIQCVRTHTRSNNCCLRSVNGSADASVSAALR